MLVRQIFLSETGRHQPSWFSSQVDNGRLADNAIIDTEDCVPAYDGCTTETGDNAACLSAGSTCDSAVESPIEEDNNFNVYDVLEPRSAESTDPPETYATYLTVCLRLNPIKMCPSWLKAWSLAGLSTD